MNKMMNKIKYLLCKHFPNFISFFKEYYFLIYHLIYNIVTPFSKPYFLLFFLVTLLSAFPILISGNAPDMVNQKIGEPFFSIISFSIVLIITSGLYLISEEFYSYTNKTESDSNKSIKDKKEYGNLFWGFFFLVLPIISVIYIPYALTIETWDDNRIIFCSFLFTISLISWILSNGGMGAKFKTISDTKSEKIDAIQENYRKNTAGGLFDIIK